MKIQHLINGAQVASKEYFQTVNPATQDVLAEVARGGEREIDAAVAAAKAAFPGWAGKPAPDTYLEAARLLGAAPAQSAVYVDALAGVEAGRAGGFGLIIGVDRVGQAAALRHHGADVIVKDLSDLMKPS